MKKSKLLRVDGKVFIRRKKMKIFSFLFSFLKEYFIFCINLFLFIPRKVIAFFKKIFKKNNEKKLLKKQMQKELLFEKERVKVKQQEKEYLERQIQKEKEEIDFEKKQQEILIQTKEKQNKLEEKRLKEEKEILERKKQLAELKIKKEKESREENEKKVVKSVIEKKEKYVVKSEVIKTDTLTIKNPYISFNFLEKFLGSFTKLKIFTVNILKTILKYIKEYLLFIYKVIVFLPLFLWSYIKKLFYKIKYFFIDLLKNTSKEEVLVEDKKVEEEVYFEKYLEEKEDVHVDSLKQKILNKVSENNLLNKIPKVEVKNQTVQKTLSVGKTVTKKALQKENFEIFTERSDDYRIDFAIIFLISLFVLYVLPLFDFIKPYMLEIYFLLCIFILFYCLHYFIIVFNDNKQLKKDK